MNKELETINLLKEKLNFYFDKPHQKMLVRINNRLVYGKELEVYFDNDKEFELLKEVMLDE